MGVTEVLDDFPVFLPDISDRLPRVRHGDARKLDVLVAVHFNGSLALLCLCYTGQVLYTSFVCKEKIINIFIIFTFYSLNTQLYNNALTTFIWDFAEVLQSKINRENSSKICKILTSHYQHIFFLLSTLVVFRDTYKYSFIVLTNILK